MSPVDPGSSNGAVILGSIAAGIMTLVTTMVGFAVRFRREKGSVNTSDARTLWDAMLNRLQILEDAVGADRKTIDDLNVRVGKLRIELLQKDERIQTLYDENQRLINRVTELENRLRQAGEDLTPKSYSSEADDVRGRRHKG